MLDVGERGVQIAKFLDLDDDTSRTRYKTTREGGWDTLSSNDCKRDRSRMALTQETELFEWLDGQFCSSTVEIGAHILKEFGLDYSESGCWKLLARLGFEYRKPKNLRRVAAAEQQAECIDMCERLLKRMREDEALYFTDPVHAEYQTKPAYGWVKAGCSLAVTTTKGRGRLNIHGALNLETFDAHFVEPTTADSTSAAHLLAKIEARNPDKRVIHVI